MTHYPIRLMIDFETPSTERTTAPLTFGAVQFGMPMSIALPEFYDKASLASVERRGFTISKETMEWWDKQDPVMRNEVFSGTQDVAELLDKFTTWCETLYGAENLKDIQLWSRGAGFDCEILQGVYMEIFGVYPFRYYNHFCQRTVEALMPPYIVQSLRKQENKHHALEDAKYQAMVMNVALNTLRWN